VREERVAAVLRRIVEARRRRLGAPAGGLAAALAAAEPAGEAAPPLLEAAGNRFLAALGSAGHARGHAGGRAIIAEVKMGSPRLGSLAGRFDPLAQARTYAAHGAAALSVVVEPDFFHGSYELLAACREASGLPAVAKDFVVHPRQLAMARAAGADAVLLIAALYERDELLGLARRARRLGLVPLVETHAADDLELLAGEPWELVGVNHRDLRTFEVDLGRSRAQLPHLPAAALKVAESGLTAASEVAALAAAGFDAFLIGESLLLAADPGARLEALRGVA
jgi:indole-3-glycerol phosphate synthase